METIGAWAQRARALVARAFAGAADAPGGLRAGLRARFSRYVRMIGGFVIAIAVLGVAALYLGAAAARVPLETEPTLQVPEGGAYGIAAAQHLFALQEPPDDLAADRLFAPASLKRRERISLSAAARVGQTYVALARVRRGARAPLLEEARAAAEERGGRAAADALARLNAGAKDQRILFDHSADGFRALAREAAAACAARAAFISERMQIEALSAETDEAAFYEARGEAFGWLIVLRAAAEDVSAEGALNRAGLARTLAALSRAASYDPVLFPGGPRGGVLAPNHLAIVGLDLAVAAQEASALAER